MTKKFASVDEEFLRETIEDGLKWQEAAQALAYLICGVNGADADVTLRAARSNLGKMFEYIEHDANCWRAIAEREDASEYIRVFAREREKALKADLDKVHRRFEIRTEGRE